MGDRARILVRLVALVASLSAAASAQGPQVPTTFRASRELVSIDVVVRDRGGNVVRGLAPDDFEIREDGAPQDLLTLSFEEINTRAEPIPESTLLAGMEARVRDAASGTSAAARTPVQPREVSLAGHRLIVLLFDLTAMEPEDVQRSMDAAAAFVTGQMSPADVVAIVTFGATLDVLTDFTGDRAALLAILRRLGASGGPDVPAADAPTQDVEVAATDALDLYNNDARLRAMRVMADALAPIEQKKAVLYFSAGMDDYGEDNQIELRAATNAAVRANLAIYPVDTRGLQVVIPGGTAREASRGGQGLFSGRQVQQQFDQLADSQDTLVSLAADTGGRAFLNSNDFAAPFVRVQRDTAAYYLLGYSSTNESRDGRFRRVQVRVKRPGLEVEARKGYFAARDFAHTSRADRETELQEQLDTDASSTDVPLIVSTGWFRMSPERYYVPVSLAIPGSALRPAAGSGAPSKRRSVDVLGLVRDEQRRAVVRFRETVEIPSGTGDPLEKRQLLYQTGATLPPGRFSVKVVVRENGGGAVGSFESPLLVPDLRRAPLRLSSIVLSTQVEPWTGGRTDNPLVRQGVQLLPNLTRVVPRDQKVFFYFEVYDPVSTASEPPQVRTSVAFYRGKVKVLETPVVERGAIDDASRMASIFQFELPPRTLAPGLYTCQINVIDAGAGTFAFPRFTLMVQ